MFHATSISNAYNIETKLLQNHKITVAAPRNNNCNMHGEPYAESEFFLFKSGILHGNISNGCREICSAVRRACFAAASRG